ncbi:MAG: UDP-N-acetylmuramoyl-tripeptide--D-alanyl-D-alanine ligase [Zetaproteobacteria bacterium]|nr:MAG: UDP-N-acetylmuramoyl-tripeptide--D-alanyl-D-alanine ligase [Zetaproteobacteria bacterium]
MRISPRLISEAVPGRWIGAPRSAAAQLALDTRHFTPGDAFLALVGARFDAHRFAHEVADEAAWLVGEEARARAAGWDALDAPQYRVRVDTLEALGEIARAARRRINGCVVAITGSVGKTTTKSMLTAMLRAAVGRVHATVGNENNLVGVPKTVLAAPEDVRVLVLELGTNQPGEIARLSAIAMPDVAVITAIAPAHLAGLGSLEGVAREKAALLQACKEGVAVVAPEARPVLARYAPAALSIREAPVPAVVPTEEGWALSLHGRVVALPLALPFAGWAKAAALSVAAARAVLDRLGMSVSDEKLVAGLASWRPEAGRMHPYRLRGGLLIDDSYNANPASMEAALAFLRTMPAPRLAVLGEMAELGEEAARFHEGLSLVGIERVVLVGELFASRRDEPGVDWFAELDEEALARIEALAPGFRTILVKGSRAARMERVVARLREALGAAHAV